MHVLLHYALECLVALLLNVSVLGPDASTSQQEEIKPRPGMNPSETWLSACSSAHVSVSTLHGSGADTQRLLVKPSLWILSLLGYITMQHFKAISHLLIPVT